jgi:hypothetical protein
MAATRWVFLGSTVLVFTWAALVVGQGAQTAGLPAGRTEKGLYLLRVVEPGYDVTVKELDRQATYSVLEMNGVVPTVTAGGVVLFRAVYDIAIERKFEYTFSGPGQGNPGNAAPAGGAGRSVAVVTKVFMTNDANMSLKDLMGGDFTAEAQGLFDNIGYRSVAQLAVLFGGRER